MQAVQRVYTVVALTAAVLGLACSNTSGVDGARITVALTDAPSIMFESAVVEIGEIRIIPMDGSPITLTENGGSFDLLDLRNGVTADLATLIIEPGRYRQLRLIVNSATVTLADGLTFRDGSTTQDLFIPSGARTGIKVNLGSGGCDGAGPGGGTCDDSTAGLEIVPGETIIIVDFDVEQNFRVQGSQMSPQGIRSVLFTPMLRAVVTNVAASIAGTVTFSDTGDPVIGGTVRATLTDPGTIEELETTEVTAVTDSAGGYKLWYLAPGTYEVSVDSLSAAAQTVAVGAGEQVTGIDFSGTF